jgi:hypothetical protein
VRVGRRALRERATRYRARPRWSGPAVVNRRAAISDDGNAPPARAVRRRSSARRPDHAATTPSRRRGRPWSGRDARAWRALARHWLTPIHPRLHAALARGRVRGCRGEGLSRRGPPGRRFSSRRSPPWSCPARRRRVQRTAGHPLSATSITPINHCRRLVRRGRGGLRHRYARRAPVHVRQRFAERPLTSHRRTTRRRLARRGRGNRSGRVGPATFCTRGGAAIGRSVTADDVAWGRGGSGAVARHSNASRRIPRPCDPGGYPAASGDGVRRLDWSAGLYDKRRRAGQTFGPHGVPVRVITARTEMRAAHHDPTVPRISDVDRQREHGPAVEAERAPAHVAGRCGPRHPRRSPAAIGNPEPAAARVSPSPVMMCGPRPGATANPCPAVRTVRAPVAVVIRTPRVRNRRIPHVPVGRLVLPRAMAIERTAVHVELTREMSPRYRPDPGVPPRRCPSVECVEACGVERLRKCRRPALTGDAALPGPDRHRTPLRGERSGPAKHGQFRFGT